MKTLHIITACSRLGFIPGMTIVPSRALIERRFLIRWHLAFQSDLQPDPHGYVKFNEMIDLIPYNEWVWILDDDNDMHPHFFNAIVKAWHDFPDKAAIVFSQNRWDEHGPVLHACPGNMRVGSVDTAQVVFKKDLIGHERFRTTYKCGDGEFYEKMYNRFPDQFAFVDNPVVNFNGLKHLHKK